MFLDHGSRRPVHRLEWRIRLMGVGAILAVVGMYFEAHWMIWIAIAVLVLGFLLRFLPGDDQRPDEEDELEENR